MNNPRLSICIATYNRADVIGQTLESIISQATDEVEIIIVDGASPDDTETVVQRYKAQCPQLRYHRLPVKGGVDRDYCHAVSFATGAYCWLLTDDDILKSGAIKTILDLLPRNYSLIVVNAEVRDRSLSQLVETKHLHIDNDTVYQPSSWEAFFINTVSYLSFIGAVVIDRALWNERIKEPYIGTDFIHIGVIFQKELPNGAFVMAEPCLSIRYGNAQWTSRHFAIWMIQWPDLIWSFSNLSNAAKSRICPKHPWNSLQTLLLMRAYGAYSLAEYNRFIEARLDSYWRLFMAKVVAIIPGIIPNFLFASFYIMIGSHDFIVWHSLKTSQFYYRQYIRNILKSLKKVSSSFGGLKSI